MSRQKCAGESLFKQIGTGKENAVTRPRNECEDRGLRKMVENAQAKGDIIINLGSGYYRPDLSNPEEIREYHHYIAQKRSRIRSHLKTITAMEGTAAKLINADSE